MNPQLYILSRPSLGEGMEQFLLDTNQSWREESPGTAAERLIEFAGRICYMSFGLRQYRGTNEAYLRNLILKEHESVLEHATWTFLLTGISRALTHQLVRHRAGFSFSQLSQQYHDEFDAIFVEPVALESSAQAAKAWKEAIIGIKRAYETICKELLPNEKELPNKEVNRAVRTAARSILPNATQTAIVVTANARSLRYFLKVRGAIEGDLEMRSVAKLIYNAFVIESPRLLSDFSAVRHSDGSYSVIQTGFRSQE